MIYIIYTSFSSYNGYKLNSHLTGFQRGFTAQLVEHRTGITEVMVSNPVQDSDFVLDFLSCFTTAKIVFNFKSRDVIYSILECSALKIYTILPEDKL